MVYRKIVGKIPIEDQGKLSPKLVDIILKSKNDDKMPSNLAKTILQYWHQGPLLREESLSALLEAAVLLEPEETVELFEEKLKLADLAKAVKRLSVQA